MEHWRIDATSTSDLSGRFFVTVPLTADGQWLLHPLKARLSLPDAGHPDRRRVKVRLRAFFARSWAPNRHRWKRFRTVMAGGTFGSATGFGRRRPPMADFEQLRNRMVNAQIVRRGVTDSRVLDATRSVPREAFVEPGFEEFAYEDAPLPIAKDQTISQPFIVARMAEAAEFEPADRVLEVGAGSGYAAAVMSRIARKVYTIER